MNVRKNNLFVIGRAVILILTLGACAHYPDVRPGEGGVHKVVLMNDEKNFSGRSALNQAEDYCETFKKNAVVVSEANKYVGSMDEDSYNKLKTGSKVAQAVGGAGYVFGGQKESAAGGIIGLGGAVADQSAGNGYKYEMVFKCN